MSELFVTVETGLGWEMILLIVSLSLVVFLMIAGGAYWTFKKMRKVETIPGKTDASSISMCDH